MKYSPAKFELECLKPSLGRSVTTDSKKRPLLSCFNGSLWLCQPWGSRNEPRPPYIMIYNVYT